MLTGQIVLGDVTWGYASKEAPVDAAWRDESRYREYASGSRELVEARYRLVGSFGFDGLSGVDLAQLKGATDRPFSSCSAPARRTTRRGRS